MTAGRWRPRAERALLTVGVGAAIAAYLLGYLPGRGTGWVPALAATFLLPSIWMQWTRFPARLVRPLSLAVIPLVATTALTVVLSRQILVPVLGLSAAHGVEFVVGGALCVLAAAFLYGARQWRFGTHVLPTTVGILIAAGIDPRASGFFPLAGVAGAALWTHALIAGGPRLRGPAVVLFVLAGAGLAAATIWFLPWAQPRVTHFVAQAYSEGKTGLSDRSELGEVESLAPSRRVVARVWTERPQLLRMQVLTHFDGRRWSVARQEERALAPLSTEDTVTAQIHSLLREIPGHLFAVATQPGGAPSVETKVLPVLSFDEGWGLLVPARPVLVAWPGENLAIDDLGRVKTGGNVVHLYGVANGGPEVGRAAPTDVDLSQPPKLDPRVLGLAAELSHGAHSDRDILRHTVDHLRSSYRYTLDVGRFEGKDPLAAFLFEKKAGYCEYFASAAVVLLRLQGVPARYVKGVSVRSENQIADHYLVRESDAHAWVEAYLRDEGWVEEDPTPTNGYELTHQTTPPGFLAERWEALSAHWSEALARFQQGVWPRLTASSARALRRAWDFVSRRSLAVAGIVAAGALVSIGIRTLRRRRRRPKVSRVRSEQLVPTELKTALGQVEKHWVRCGRPRPPSQGLREHLEGIPEANLTPGARAASARVVEAYYRTAFGGRVPSGEELAELRRAAQALP